VRWVEFEEGEVETLAMGWRREIGVACSLVKYFTKSLHPFAVFRLVEFLSRKLAPALSTLNNAR
jgi:hypothetical protein